MAQHEAWQVGGSAAELYQRYLVPAIASLWAADLIDRAAPRPGERVLDVACGNGVVSRLAARCAKARAAQPMRHSAVRGIPGRVRGHAKLPPYDGRVVRRAALGVPDPRRLLGKPGTLEPRARISPGFLRPSSASARAHRGR